ncbi:hypothetical protein H7X87_01680 [Acetobacteraceae bacterium]|nr:hypothetical protein [Candidatus Parcubacteria bacterium]
MGRHLQNHSPHMSFSSFAPAHVMNHSDLHPGAEQTDSMIDAAVKYGMERSIKI